MFTRSFLNWEYWKFRCYQPVFLGGFFMQPLARLTPVVACPWPCPHLETNPSTTLIHLTLPISLLPIRSTTSTRAWVIATRSLWPPTPTHGLRALAACCRLKARRARTVSRNRYLSVCLSVHLPAATTSQATVKESHVTKYVVTRLGRILQQQRMC